MAKLNEELLTHITRKPWKENIKEALEMGEFKKDGLNLEYDGSIEDELTGHCFKFFCKCDSEPAERLERIYQSNPNNGFITYIDKKIQQGELPPKISVLLKNMPYEKAMNEALGSQVLGLLGVPTCFNFVIDPEEKTKERMLGSINFMQPEKRFASCISLGMEPNSGFETVQEKYKQIELVLMGYPRDQVEKVKQQYSLMFLCRAFVIGDFDYGCNYGMIKNLTTADLISYDYEHSFHLSDISRFEERDIDTVRYTYYGLYTDFINKLKDIREVIQSGEIEIYDETHSKMLKKLYSNIANVLNYHNNLSEEERNKVYPII